MEITLKLDFIQAVLLRNVIADKIEELRFSDCDDDAIDLARLCELGIIIEKEMRK